MLVELQLAVTEGSIADVLDGERLREERVDDSDSLGPVPRATELGELDSLRDS